MCEVSHSAGNMLSSLTCLMLSWAAATAAAGASQTTPVSALLERLLPGLSTRIQLRLDPALPRCFVIDDVKDLPGHQIAITAGDTATLAAGAGYYLRERANLTIGWPRGGGSRVNAPSSGWPSMAVRG